ncbi:MAG: hypothetical protein M3Z22_03250 [Verrucomicrobiota bacterium]|nr:hypothetical protein [Verrucomicrobiota bacterium]
MSRHTNHNSPFLTLLLALMFAFSATALRAQTASKVYKIGERVEVNLANDSESDERWFGGTVTRVNYTDDGRILSYMVKLDRFPDGSGGLTRQILDQPRILRPASSGGEATNTAPAQQELRQINNVRQQSARKYRVGQRVEYVSDGKWHKAIVIQVASDQEVGPYHVYKVHQIGYNDILDAWVGDFGDHRDQLRPDGAGATEPVPGGEESDEVLRKMNSRAAGASAKSDAPAPVVPQRSTTAGAVVAKAYHCVYFSVNHLVTTAGITITGSSTYSDSNGATGTYTLDASSSTLTFHGGNYDGQRAEYEVKGGRPLIHILGPSGRRVIDCN